MEPRFYKTQSELSEWFDKNHDKFAEQWIGYYKKSSGRQSIIWEESVEAAICYGWIDGLRKSIDEDRYMIRFTPRKKSSNWSLKNIKTAEALIKKGAMHPAGFQAFKARKEDRTGVYSFEQEEAVFDKDFLTVFRANVKAWSFFTMQTPTYQKTVKHWVMRAKQEETRRKRLYELMSDSENERKIKPLRRSGD